jgi:hypothetical protein
MIGTNRDALPPDARQPVLGQRLAGPERLGQPLLGRRVTACFVDSIRDLSREAIDAASPDAATAPVASVGVHVPMPALYA